MITVQTTTDQEAVAKALALRHQVFVIEQRVPIEEELDQHDAHATHFVASENERLLGTCRVRCQQKIARLERLAVKKTARGRGVATQLLLAVEGWAANEKMDQITLHAQTDAIVLYEKLAYRAVGERFFEAGIEHQKMWKEIQVNHGA